MGTIQCEPFSTEMNNTMLLLVYCVPVMFVCTEQTFTSFLCVRGAKRARWRVCHWYFRNKRSN